MSFVGEIRAMPYNFAPKSPEGWLLCNGDMYSIVEYRDLYNVIGRVFGWNEKEQKFCVPDLRGRIAVCTNMGATEITRRALGEAWGSSSVTLLEGNIPSHTHRLNVPYSTVSVSETVGEPDRLRFLSRTLNQCDFVKEKSDAYLHAQTLLSFGKKEPKPHENRQPVTGIPYFICASGDIPQRPQM